MSTDSLRILMVTESFRIGGKERRLLELLKGLKDHPRVHCHIVILKNLIQYGGLEDLPYKVTFLIRHIKKDPTTLFRLRKLIKEYRPDIIHSWGGMASVYAIPMGKLMGIKTVNGMVTNSTRLKFFTENWNRSRVSFPFSDVILANSHAGLRAYQVSAKKGKVIYNGFNHVRLDALSSVDETRTKFGLPDTLLIGMVGALHDRKDHKTFILAAHQILSMRKDVDFVIVGDGPNYKRCKELARHYFNNGIYFIGNLREVESVINLFEVGVLTTNQDIHGEGISNAILEYMALGKPVIATKGGGNGEIVEDDVTGFLIEEFSPTKLAEKINWLLEHPQVATQFGDRGRERVRDIFSYENMIEGTLQIYKELVDR